MTSDDFPHHHPQHTPAAFAGFLATLALLAALAALSSGCSTAAAVAPAQAPQAQAPVTGCAAVQRDIAQAAQEGQAARERQSNAWKVVVPFAVLARHAQAGADAGAADQRLAALRAQAHKEGCGDGS